jgi:hypothetical protein
MPYGIEEQKPSVLETLSVNDLRESLKILLDLDVADDQEECDIELQVFEIRRELDIRLKQ